MSFFYYSQNNNLANSRQLLWENPNSTQVFNAQSVDILSVLNEYDELEIYSKAAVDSDRDVTTFMVKGITNAFIEYFSRGASFSTSVMYQRNISISWNTNRITFGDCVAVGSSVTTNNRLCIPFKIYGIKYF